jgi:hypothetical protein
MPVKKIDVESSANSLTNIFLCFTLYSVMYSFFLKRTYVSVHFLFDDIFSIVTKGFICTYHRIPDKGSKAEEAT